METDSKRPSSLPLSASSTDASKNNSKTSPESMESGITDEEKLRAEEVAVANSNNADPFGNEEGNAVQYKTMSWIQTAFVMIAETVSLGILSLPYTLNAVGLIPGIILIIGLGIISTYTGYVLGQFKLRFPQVHSFAEAGEILCGKAGYHIFATAQLLFLIFVMGAHILSFSIMMNTVTNHSTCTIIFTFVGFIVSLLFTLPRTLKSMTVLSYVSSLSVLVAVVVCMFGVGFAPPRTATPVRMWPAPHTTLHEAFGAVTNIIFAYAGHVAFFTLFSEMKQPEDFWKSLLVLQGGDLVLYTITAVVIYWFTGEGVRSPALGSTTPLISKIAYGLALPTIIIAGVINGHVAAKYLWVVAGRTNRGKACNLLGSNSWTAFFVWASILLVLWFVSWIIASAIPVFNHLLSFIAALFLSWFTYGLSGVFWLYMNKGHWWKGQKPLQRFLCIVNWGLIPMGALIMIIGLYSSGLSMTAEPEKTRAFSCADNSGF